MHWPSQPPSCWPTSAPGPLNSATRDVAGKQPRTGTRYGSSARPGCPKIQKKTLTTVIVGTVTNLATITSAAGFDCIDRRTLLTSVKLQVGGNEDRGIATYMTDLHETAAFVLLHINVNALQLNLQCRRCQLRLIHRSYVQEEHTSVSTVFIIHDRLELLVIALTYQHGVDSQTDVAACSSLHPDNDPAEHSGSTACFNHNSAQQAT